MNANDVDWHPPYDAALDTLLGTVDTRQVDAFVDLFAAHEALMSRVEAKHGPARREPYTPRMEVALALLRQLGVTDARIDEARKLIEAGGWETGTPTPTLTLVQ